MATWHLVAMGQTGLTGSTAKAVRPIVSRIAGGMGRSEAQILLAIFGAGFLAITLRVLVLVADAPVRRAVRTPDFDAGVRSQPGLVR